MPTPEVYHDTGKLAYWLFRAERQQRHDGKPFPSAKERNGRRKFPVSQESPAVT
jgi:hypothetical protein